MKIHFWENYNCITEFYRKTSLNPYIQENLNVAFWIELSNWPRKEQRMFQIKITWLDFGHFPILTHIASLWSDQSLNPIKRVFGEYEPSFAKRHTARTYIQRATHFFRIDSGMHWRTRSCIIHLYLLAHDRASRMVCTYWSLLTWYQHIHFYLAAVKLKLISLDIHTKRVE